MFEYLERLATESLGGNGTSYVIDVQFVLKYIILIFILHFIIYRLIKRKDFEPKKYFTKVAFAFYFVILVLFTLLPIYFPGIGEPRTMFNFSLMPMLGVLYSRTYLINFVGNILLFAPISILGYISGLKIFKKWSTTAIFMLAISLLIEGLQYVEMIHGYTSLAVVDIIDVITNVAGGLLGLALVKFWIKSHNMQTKNEQ